MGIKKKLNSIIKFYNFVIEFFKCFFIFITIFNSTITFFPLYKWTSWFFHKWRGFYPAIIMLKLILTKGVTGNRIFLRARLPEHVASPRKERALRRYNTTRHCSSACNSRMSHNFPFFCSKCQDKNFPHTRNARIYFSLVSFNNIFLEDASAYISLNIFMRLFCQLFFQRIDSACE